MPIKLSMLMPKSMPGHFCIRQLTGPLYVNTTISTYTMSTRFLHYPYLIFFYTHTLSLKQKLQLTTKAITLLVTI